jgi:hypothetical protein
VLKPNGYYSLIKEKTMVISNLNYLETMSKKTMVQCTGSWYGRYGGFDFDLDVASNFGQVNQTQVGGIGNGQLGVVLQNADA